MPLSMFDRLLVSLACNHQVVVGRLDKVHKWTCEECGRVTDFQTEPYRSHLAEQRETADQLDKQERENGKTVHRAG